VAGEQHARWKAGHASARVGHSPASEIYSQARGNHAPARGNPTSTCLVAAGSGGAQELGEGGREVVELPEVDRSSFEKTRSKSFKKGRDPGLRNCGGAENRPSCGEAETMLELGLRGGG